MSLSVQQKFKKTPIGNIPAEWRFAPIKTIAEESTLRSLNDGTLPVILCSKHVGFIRSLDYFKKKIFSDDTSNYKVIKRNWFGYPSNHVEEGSIGLQNICDAGIVSPIYTVFFLNNEVDCNYLIKLLKTELYRLQFASAMNGSVDRRGSLRWGDFSKIKIPIPPLNEQIKIASVLKVLDDKLDVIGRKIAMGQKIKQGLRQTLFSRGIGIPNSEGNWVPHTEFNDTPLGSIPLGWTITSLKNLSLLKISNGAFNDPKKVGSGYKLINIFDLYQGSKIRTENLSLLQLNLSEFETFKALKGDLFFTRSSLKKEGIAHCNIFLSDETDIVYECHMMRVRPNQDLVDSKFLQEFCLSGQARDYFVSHGKTTTMTTIDQGAIGGLPVLLPPMVEQRKIAAVFNSLDDKLEIFKRQQVTYQILKRGLMQKLLTGEWRLKIDESSS